MASETSSSKSNKEKKFLKKRSSGMKLSTDPQSVAARERRHRISERFKILQSLVPGGTKMDTVSVLEEAIHYVKFLKTQIWLHQAMMPLGDSSSLSFPCSPSPQPSLCSPILLSPPPSTSFSPCSYGDQSMSSHASIDY